MADEKKNNNAICNGSKQTVTVEESSPDVVLVRLEYSGIIYRGALLNISNRDVPCGVNALRLQSNVWTRIQQPEDDAPKNKGKDSSVVSRFSYQADTIQPLPAKPVPQTKTASRGYKEKTVRNIRLRPRQVLCAKCKNSCSDNQENKPKSAIDSANKSPPKVTLPPPTIPLKISLKKENSSESVKTRQTSKAVIPKASPIIKISFNNPQGEGTVVNIPRKVHNSEQSESENEDASESSGVHTSILGSKRVKKSVRKAKDRLHPYAKHSKHKKHKHKHDKKLSQQLNPVVALSPLNLDNLNNEIREAPVTPEEDPSIDNPYRSPLKTKVIMKRQRSASGSFNYVYQAQRVSDSPNLPDDSCAKNLTINLRRVDEVDAESKSEPDKNDDDEENMGPLMMRFQKKSVCKVILEDDRTISAGDIVWGKIHGFPWWPGRVETITIGQNSDGRIISQQAHVSWFGSSTTSDMACSDLYNFLDDFDTKFNKKKRGPYRVAIKEATRLARGLLAISEETDSQNPDAGNAREGDFDVDIEGLSSGRTSPAQSGKTTPALSRYTSPTPADSEQIKEETEVTETSPTREERTSPVAVTPPIREDISYSPAGNNYWDLGTAPSMEAIGSSYSENLGGISYLAQNESRRILTEETFDPVDIAMSLSPPHLTPPDMTSFSPALQSHMTSFSPRYSPSPTPVAQPKYSPISDTSPNDSPLSTPKYSPIPRSPNYSPNPRTSKSPKYSTSPYYSTTPKYPPVPMMPFHYSPAPVTSPYMTSPLTSPYNASTVTSPYLSTASPYNANSVASPYTGNSGISVASPYTGNSVTSPYTGNSVTSPYTGNSVTSPYTANSVTSPYVASAVNSPYTFSPAPGAGKASPARSPVSGSSPKPLARYSPQYSPVTPTPSPLHSPVTPVMASPMQCV